MLFDDMLKHPVVKQVLATGEERATQVIGKLMADERVTNGLQELLAAAAAARATLAEGLKQALHAANLPSASEVTALRHRLEELEAMLADLAARQPPVTAPPPAETPPTAPPPTPVP
jgi:polyhydroxyalkanoate synthesis regulator phasin